MIENITLDEAMELFRLPKQVGEYNGTILKVNVGRFGPYVQHGTVFASLPKGLDPHDVTEEKAIEILLDKLKKDAEKVIKTFDANPDVKLLNGRWGAFLAIGKENYKLPKGTEPANHTLDECLAIAASQPASSKAKGKTFTKAKATTAKKKK